MSFSAFSLFSDN